MRRRRGGAGEGIALALLLLGCASSASGQEKVSVRAETPAGEPLQDALQRLEVRAPNGRPFVGAAVTVEAPPARLPAHALRVFPLSAPVPSYVSLLFGERVLETREVKGAGDVVFKIDPDEIVRALRTVHVRFVARPEDLAATGPDIASAALWLSPWSSMNLDVRGGSCEIARAMPGEGLLVVSGRYALAMLRIDVTGASDLDLELPLVRPAAVSGRVEVPDMTDPACDVYALPLDGGFPPPPLGFAPRCPVDENGGFTFPSGPRGRQVILASKPGFGIGWARVDNTKGPVAGVRITLRKGVQVGIAAAHEGLEAPYVQVETEDGIPLFARLIVFEKRATPVLTLAEGRYVLRHRVFGGEWQTKPLTVGKERVIVHIP